MKRVLPLVGDDMRIDQLTRIAEAEALGSVGYLTHVGLLMFASICGVYIYGAWIFAWLTLIYVIAFTVEKVVAARAVNTLRFTLYWPVLGLLSVRTIIYNIAVVYVWSLDGDVFKFAAAALLVVATINVFVFHATHVEIIAVVIAPIWLSYFAITTQAFVQLGLTQEPMMFLLITVCVIPYFLLALRVARSHWTKHDILQQSLSHTQRLDALGQLVAGVAHDFNNILTVTRGNAELMSDITGPERDELAREIINASDRGSTLAGQLLAFGRRSDLSPVRIQPTQLLAHFETMLRRLLPENITLTTSSRGSLPDIFADKHQLETAIMNLVLNARDAIDGNGVIEIDAGHVSFTKRDVEAGRSTLKPGDYVIISVSDTGCGISEELKDSVFNPFFTTKPTNKGSGLGLSMVIGFSKQSGGGVRLQSEVGLGTRVSLCLPALPAKTAPHLDPAGT